MQLDQSAFKNEATRIISFLIKPHLLSVNEIEVDDEYDLPSSSSDLFLGATKLYIVVGCVAALLALALLQATCTLYRSSKRRATKVRPVVLETSSSRIFPLTTVSRIPSLLSVAFCSSSNDFIVATARCRKIVSIPSLVDRRRYRRVSIDVNRYVSMSIFDGARSQQYMRISKVFQEAHATPC